MPCYFPLQATFSLRVDGKKNVKFSNENAKLFAAGHSLVGSNNLSLPCGRCIGCRLERSRQWAVRIMHESSLYDFNSYLTLTYDDDHLPSNLSLDKRDFQLFMMRLRQDHSINEKRDLLYFSDFSTGIRYFHCGEYGEQNARPHYHACMFNIDFRDKKFYKFNDRGDRLFISDNLSKIWSKGHVVIGELSFESAAYVSRYCLKKVTGEAAADHYKGRLPEYCTMSRRPGIAARWYAKFSSDVYPQDIVISRGVKCKPPRYYDKLLEQEDAECFELLKEQRIEQSEKRSEDNSCARLQVREKVKSAQIKSLSRSL